MKTIKCKLRNASTEINGVKFVEVDGVMVSEPVDADTAALFDGIPGYEVADAVPETAAEKKAREKAEKEAAEAKAKAEAGQGGE